MSGVLQNSWVQNIFCYCIWPLRWPLKWLTIITVTMYCTILVIFYPWKKRKGSKDSACVSPSVTLFQSSVVSWFFSISCIMFFFSLGFYLTSKWIASQDCQLQDLCTKSKHFNQDASPPFVKERENWKSSKQMTVALQTHSPPYSSSGALKYDNGD